VPIGDVPATTISPEVSVPGDAGPGTDSETGAPLDPVSGVLDPEIRARATAAGWVGNEIECAVEEIVEIALDGDGLVAAQTVAQGAAPAAAMHTWIDFYVARSARGCLNPDRYDALGYGDQNTDA